MGKGFKGKACTYCGVAGSSDTGDHVFAREFLPISFRGSLPKVPACRACNNAKSQLEHYLLTVLPFAGMHPAMSGIMSEVLPKRLRGNRKLHQELARARSEVDVRIGEEVYRSMSIPLESECFVDLFRYVTRGLVAHHWSRLIPQNYVVRGGFFTPFGESLMRKVFQMRPAAVAQGNIGQGLLMYEGVQGVDDGNLTIWRFRLYGGLVMADDLSRVEQKATDLWMTTGAADGANFFDFD